MNRGGGLRLRSAVAVVIGSALLVAIWIVARNWLG